MATVRINGIDNPHGRSTAMLHGAGLQITCPRSRLYVHLDFRKNGQYGVFGGQILGAALHEGLSTELRDFAVSGKARRSSFACTFNRPWQTGGGEHGRNILPLYVQMGSGCVSGVAASSNDVTRPYLRGSTVGCLGEDGRTPSASYREGEQSDGFLVDDSAGPWRVRIVQT